MAQTLSSYQLGLLLDEPTTHLDQQGIQVLIEELQYYYGTLIVVSHDRYLLNQLATKIWEVDQGKVTEYAGNYDSYRQQKSKRHSVLPGRLRSISNKTAVDPSNPKEKEQAIKSSRISEKAAAEHPTRPFVVIKTKDTVQKSLQKQSKPWKAAWISWKK